jgi:phosphatidylserine/phosphatidylglycerophosphate/cardiolipin synthase-like enzyme
VDHARVLVAPDNVADTMVAELDWSEESVRVVQVAIDGPDQRFFRAAVRAAERGVEVRGLLFAAWYVREANSTLAERRNDRAEREGLPLTARLADPGGWLGEGHAKGVVLDDTVLVGSLNWNPTSARENREVLLALESAGAARYYATVFDADWAGEAADRGPDRSLPLCLLIVVMLGAALSLAVASRL